MKTLSKDYTINYFSPNLKKVMEVNQGEIFKIETHDCYGGQVQTENVLRKDIDISIMNLATGPVYINGIHKNDIIKVDILDIELGKRGIMMTSEGLGVLGKNIKNSETKLFSIDDDQIRFTKKLSFPIKPMIGVIGIATDKNKIHTAVPGEHGGNLDTTKITIGNSLYFRVFQDGGLLALGDLHASMGDGELNGTGIEVDGTVTLSVSKVECKNIFTPLVEDSESLYLIHSDKNIEKAIETLSKNAVYFLMETINIDFSLAYRILSAYCNIQISQIVNELVTVRLEIPKIILSKESL